MDTSSFVAGGYFLARQASAGADYAPSPLLPDKLTTLCSCLADLAFEYWWNEEGAAAAERFGVPPTRHGELITWYTDRFGSGFGAPNVACSLPVIDEFVAEFVADPDGLAGEVEVIACGLTKEASDSLLDTSRVTGESGEYGVLETLERGQPLASGGQVIGFEPMSYQYGLECSWVCNGLPDAVALELSITPDPSTGLLRTLDDAEQAVGYIDRPDVGAEPGKWLPWLVARYPLDPAARVVTVGAI